MDTTMQPPTETAPRPAQNSATTVVRELSLPISQSKGWLRLLGVLSIIYGVLMALSIVGIVVAWLPIWIGVLLLQTASTVERAQLTGDKNTLYESLGKLKTLFTIQGIMALLGLVFVGLAFAMGVFGAMLEAVKP